MRGTLERKATAGEMSTATLIVHAIKDATDTGHPLVGQVAVGTAAGMTGSARSIRRRVSNVIWLCYKISPILYPDLVFNRNNSLVYTVGVPTVFEQLQNALTRLFITDTELATVINGLMATHNPDAATVAAIANSMRGVAKINEATLFEILAKYAPTV